MQLDPNVNYKLNELEYAILLAFVMTDEVHYKFKPFFV